MNLLDFCENYPALKSCRKAFKAMREREGVRCQHCGSADVVWLESKQQYQCRHCRHRTTLRSGTVMQGSKLPFRYWFIAMHLLTATKKAISALEMQRQIGHKRYQPIWEMMHKLRSVMGIRDGKYTLKGNVEIDEGFFTTEIPEGKKDEKLKAGSGSQRKAEVLVMAESKEVENPKPGKKPKKVGFIKMVVLPDGKSETIDAAAESSVDGNADVVTDDHKSHTHFKSLFKSHDSRVIDPKDIGKVLPWVHIAIANAKTTIVGIYHGLKAEFLQGYLSEFCYKFNRRYFGDRLFDRLMVAAVSYRTEFRHRIYGKP